MWRWSPEEWPWSLSGVRSRQGLSVTIPSTNSHAREALGAAGLPPIRIRPFHTYFPSGEETYTFSSTHVDRMRFTGHERGLANTTAQADDLDYMHARHESPTTGRFLSVDRVSGSFGRPQSWNRYSSVQGAPVRFTDPLGLCR